MKIKNSIGLESEYTKILGEVATTFDDLERHVILHMDEVHIRSDASYEGGRVLGRLTIRTIRLLLCFLYDDF